jgi:hypothetical protein
MSRHCIAIVFFLVALAAAAWSIGRTPEILFEKHALDLGSNETCAVADLNRDGRLDIVSGENWYEGPRWTRHHFRTISYTDNYIDNFSDLPADINGDGAPDVVSCSYFTKELYWMQNPGRGAGDWKKNPIENGWSVEFVFLVDIDNDGNRQELLPQFGQQNAPLTWYELKNGAYVRHIVSPRSYGHGIGAGDVNGDKRTDILTPKGWFEAPADPRTGDWKFHPDWDLDALGFIYVLDVNGDGRNDIVTSLGHNYGVFWLERGEGTTWTKHLIDESWSQAHAMTMVDLNGDGRMDFVTGKRFMAHNGHDPGEREPLGIYWYEYLKGDDGKKIEWVKHVVDYGSRTGGGMQIPVVDIDSDGDLDFMVAGKSGLFLFENLTRHK